MPRGEKKYHYLYKTTNLKNGKFYVGMHSTDNLYDGYLGSGMYLRRSIRKYGKDNFKLEILEFFGTREILIEQEEKLNLNFIKDSMCMNLRTGGTSAVLGNTFAKGTRSEESKAKMRKPKTEEHKKNIALANIGKKASKKTRKKMSDSRCGENNVMYGRKGGKNPLYGKKSNNPNYSYQLKKWAEKKRKQVFQFKDNELIASYSSTYEAAEKTGIHRVNISKAARGVLKTANGFRWSYQSNI
jgi:group I intron endonuclease